MQILTSSSVIGHPALGRVAAARAVPAGHRDRAARHGGRARPRLGFVDAGPRADGLASAHSRGDRLGHLGERARSCGRSRARRSRAAPATMPPARDGEAFALTRGLTQTIRCASRARRSISRPTSSGSPRSQPSERITTTAPRAMPRRPWRSLNAFSASPMRVPLDQSGAAAAARRIARSGLREASARVRRVSRVAKTNASAWARCRRRRSGTGGRRARRAPSSPRCRTASRAGGGSTRGAGREPDRVAAGAQAARAACAAGRPAGRAAALVAAGAAQRRREREPRHQPVQLRELVGVERVERLPRAAPRRWPAQRHVDAPPSSSPRPAPADARAARAPALPPRRVPAGGAVGPWARSRLGRASSAGATRRRPSRTRASNAGKCEWSDTNTARAVQYSRRRLTGRMRVSARAKAASRSGVTGTPASCRRRPNAAASAGRSSSIVSTLKTAGSIRSARAGRGRPRGSPPGPRRTSAPCRACGRRAGVESLDAQQAQRGEPVDRLGDAGRLLDVGVAHA